MTSAANALSSPPLLTLCRVCRYGAPDRPLSGYINFCPRSDDLRSNNNALEALVDTAVHEIIHTLFMSQDLFPLFINSAGDTSPCVSFRHGSVFGVSVELFGHHRGSPVHQVRLWAPCIAP